MSHQQNDEWLEAAYEHFNEAVENGYLEVAKDIIADTQDAGFLEAGRIMNLQLRNTPIIKFLNKSPYQNE